MKNNNIANIFLALAFLSLVLAFFLGRGFIYGTYGCLAWHGIFREDWGLADEGTEGVEEE